MKLCGCIFRHCLLSTRLAIWQRTCPKSVRVVLSLDATNHTLVLSFSTVLVTSMIAYGPQTTLGELMACDFDSIARELAEQVEPLTRAGEEFERSLAGLYPAWAAANEATRQTK